jgi:hypothetical protein
MESINHCSICRDNYENEAFVSMVHKWRDYGGYSEFTYPRNFCSKKCLDTFEKYWRCNHCHIVMYDWVKYKKGTDGMTYCNDESYLTVGDKPCFQLVMPDSGIIRTYYENGKLEEEYFQINGKEEGLYTRYFTTGYKIRTCEYVDGKKNGLSVEYHDHSDDIFYKCFYHDDIKVGEAIFYHKNGTIDNICKYENNKINGMRYWYYETGILKKKCNYINGLVQGDFMYYNSDGAFKYCDYYVDNEIHNNEIQNDEIEE